jgi:AraC family cel operon transcriptional repressor
MSSNSELLISEIIPNGNFFTALTMANNNQVHCHEFVEIFYVVSGSAIHVLNGQKTMVTSGDLYIVKPSDYHCFKSSDSTINFIHRDICVSIEEYKEICAFLDLPSFEEMLNSNTTLHAKLDVDTIAFLERNFNSFNLDINSKSYNRLCRSITSSILLFASNDNAHFAHTAIPGWIQDILDLLRSPYLYNMSVSEITKEIPYTKQHICNTFKKYMGQSITEYFLQQRLNYAKYLLLSTTDSVANIANITGFNNTSFFYRRFKQQFDVTPSELRKTTK